MLIAGFQIIDTLYESDITRVYLALNPENKSKVTIKMYAGNFPRPEDYKRLQYEYNITSNLNIDGVIKPIAIHKSGYNYVLIREYFEGQTLQELLTRYEKSSFPLEEFFQIASKLADLVGKLHDQGVVHKDINPSNVIYQPSTGQIRILDFGIASRYDLATLSMSPLRKMEGTLAYISPEQTGRVNKNPDHRSDLYAMGITFYELLTGHQPFVGVNPNEIIYGHLAKTPMAISKFRPEIPEIIEEIVFKLIAKNPEDRYQSAFGLRSDMERAYAYFSQQGEIPLFELAQFDFSSHFQISSKLYGREEEINQIKNICELSGGSGTHFVIIHGVKGIGKSRLAQEFKRYLDFRKAITLEAQFSSIYADVPFFGWKQLFSQFLDEILKKDEKYLTAIRKSIEELVGINIKVLESIIPKLELLMGKLFEVPVLPPSENQLRFNFVFRSFFKIISQKHQPFTIVLDDIHLADSASIYLLGLILEDPELDKVLVVVNFTDEGAKNNEDLANFLQKAHSEYNHLDLYKFDLQRIGIDDIHDLLTDSIKMESETMLPMAQLVYTKTQGNPHFVHQLLYSFYQSKILLCESQNLRWIFDEEKAGKWSISENVILLLTEKVTKCPKPTLEILALAAALEADFTLDLLTKVLEHDERAVLEAMIYGLNEGILIYLQDQLSISDPEVLKMINPKLRFIHSDVALAFTQTLEPEKIGFIHFQAGKELLDSYKKSPSEELLFKVLRHLNNVSDHIFQDRDELITLNFEAGQKSKWACNYMSSLQFFQKAISLFDQEKKKTDFKLYFKIELAVLESLYLIGKFEDLDQRFEQIFPLAQSKSDKYSCLELKILSKKARQQLQDAIELIGEGFELLEVKIPKHPSEFQIMSLHLQCRLWFAYRQRQGFDEMPEMKNENLILVDRHISNALLAIYFSDATLVPYLILYRLRNCLQYGHSPDSPIIFATYAMVLISVSREYHKAFSVAAYAQKLARSRQLISTIASTDFICLSFVDIWQKSFRELLSPLYSCYEEGMKNGAIEYGSYALSNHSFFAFFAGNSLMQVSDDCKKSAKLIIDYRQESTLRFFKLLQQFADILISGTISKCELSGETFNKEEALQRYQATKDETGLLVFHTFEVLICIIHQGKPNLGESLERLLDNLGASYASVYHIIGHYIAGLALIEAAKDELSLAGRKKIRKQIKKHLLLLKKCAAKAPYNFGHFHLHLQAAYLQLEGKKETSLLLYEQALELALVNEKLMESAMISEAAALLCLDMSKNVKAEFFIQKSYVNYRKWGAKSKAEEFVKNLAWKSALTFSPDNIHIGITHTRDFGKKSHYELDIASILMASQTLSTEIIASKLVDKLTGILLETAGASKILLMENNNGQLHLLAEGYLRNNAVWVENYLEEESKLSIKEKQYFFDKSIKIKAPKNLLYFILRTRQIYVEDDLLASQKFDEEEYVQHFKPKSVLCFPVLYKGEIKNLLYLENNLVEGAFTPERVSLLEMISSQIAISLENARLYQSMEDKVKDRTSEVVKQKEIIEKKNEDITASINYGKRIQDALLPRKSQIKKAFQDAFVFFRPRDIVSGDFYWMKEVQGKTLLAVADCTGHGVPGAFVSLIGHNLLNEIVVQNEELSPALILKKLHSGLSIMLNNKSNTTQDGMDIGVCVLDNQHRTLTYAGAKVPLLYMQANVLYQIKGERCSIGDNTFSIESFTEHVIPLDVPTTCYMFTDGFQDQFGGLHNKKYLINRLKNFLFKIHDLSMSKQQGLLETEFKNWMGSESQVDDVLVLGFKVD
jgi:histidine kinase